MFTKEDYQEYFEQMASMERTMIYCLKEDLLLLEDYDLRNKLEEIAKDEMRHYLYIMEIFDSILFHEEAEKRKFFREHALGRVKIKQTGKDVIIEGYCYNISQGGIGVEFNKKFDLGGELELWIDLYDKPGAMHCHGRLSWCVEVDPNLSLGKITCKAGVELRP